ncbi:MAG: hypothetical protein ACPGLV_15125 [Bacteroidia bacterium]
MKRAYDFNLFEYIINEKQKGKSYSEIRLELKNIGLDEFEVDDAIKLADEELLDQLAQGGISKPIISKKTTAYGLIIFGIGITIFTYANAAQYGGMYVIMYGPIIGGMAMLTNDRIQRRKQVFRSPYSKWRNRY